MGLALHTLGEVADSSLPTELDPLKQLSLSIVASEVVVGISYKFLERLGIFLLEFHFEFNPFLLFIVEPLVDFEEFEVGLGLFLRNLLTLIVEIEMCFV